MNTSTATSLLALLELVNTLIELSNEPVLDNDGQVIAGSIREYKAQSSTALFKKQFSGKSMEEIDKEINGFLEGK